MEQFCITSPNDDDFWKVFEEMMKDLREFYQQVLVLTISLFVADVLSACSRMLSVMADQFVFCYVVVSSISRGVNYFGSFERFCCQEVRFGGTVFRFQDIQ